MNKKIERFAEICAKSRYYVLTQEEHLEKIRLVNEIVEDGFLKNSESYDFIDDKDCEYFINTIKSYLKHYDSKKYENNNLENKM